MTELFMKVLSMSLSSLWLFGAVVLLRLALKRSPKWIHVLLWALVAIRLVCPFSFESSLSLVPEDLSSGAVLEEWSDDYVGEVEIIHDIRPEYQTAVDAGREPVSAGEGGYYVVTGPDGISEPETVKTAQLPILSGIWLAGMVVMVLYTVFSYTSLRRKMATSVRLKGNIYQSEAAASPFVLGLIRPKIYLPFTMDEMDIPHVIAHERAHIRRKDHWWKPLGFLVLTIHWFNPAVWLGYILLCRDIELACDEKVIRDMNLQQQADYSQALLNCSVHRRSIAACPLAFGEVGVKQRVANILHYKKPGFWVLLIALIACIALAVCFLTNPVRSGAPFGQDWYTERFLYQNIDMFSDSDMLPEGDYAMASQQLDGLLYAHYRLSEDGELSVLEGDTEKWATLGTFREEHLSMLNFDDYFKQEDVWKTTLYRPEKFRETYTRAWRLDVNPEGQPGLFYLLLEMEDGRFYLMCGYDENTSHAAQEARSTMYWVIRLTRTPPEEASALYWFDHTETYPQENTVLELMMPEFPDVTFQAVSNEIRAVRNGESTVIISGMPVWNAFLCDLTGDGVSEICATVSFGSGIIDEHVVVYDYVTGTEYTLWERGVFDYTLRLEDGKLVCDRWFYPHNGLSASGPLMLVSAGGGDDMRLEIVTDDTKEEPTSVSFADFDFSSVTDIMLTNAHNGKSTAISDPDSINQICNFLSGISGANVRSSKGNHHQGTFVLTLMDGETQAFQITFGDDDIFFHGSYDEKYSRMYDLVDRDMESVIRFLYRYDESGYDWGYEETVAVAETTPYGITQSIPEDGLKGDIEFLQPGDIIGYGFLKEERRDLAVLLNSLTEDAFETPVDYTPTMKINLRWEGGRMTLYSDGKQTVFGDDQTWAVRNGDLNKFLSRFTQERLEGGEQLPLEELNPYYNSEQAMIDGCVVMYDHDIRENADVFTAFADAAASGNPATVRIAEFDSEARFAVQVSDIMFDGEGFLWQAISDGQLYERKYSYLRYFAGEADTVNASYDAYEAYILTDNRDATWEQLWNSLYSSQAGVAIDFTLVYMDYIYYPDHPVIPDCEKITLEYDGELLLNAGNIDALEALFSQAEETYEPKTWNPGPILRFTGKDGTELVIELGLYTDWVRIDGIYYDFGPGFDEDGAYDALAYLFSLLGIEDWPQEVKDAYPDFF